MRIAWIGLVAGLLGWGLACGGDEEPGPKASGTSTGGAGAAGGSGGAGGGACTVPSAIEVSGEPIPGRTLDLSLVGEQAGETTWLVSVGSVDPPTGPTSTWTLPTDIAVHVPATATVTAVVGGPGCDDVPLMTNVTVDWPLPLRTIVLSNPNAPGSADVADHYATFRGVPADHHCQVPASDQTVLPGAELDAWIDAVLACTAAVGEHVHYIVPVWGVPYKVSGRIDDLANAGVKATVSLDALLAYGPRAKTLTEPLFNPLYQDGDSPSATYDPWIPFGVLREEENDELYMVARIDGADADAAKALVDRTAAADQLAARGMLDGVVYVDGNQGLPHPTTDMFGSYESGEWNIIGVDAVFTALGTYDVLANYDNAEFGTAPAPLTCPDALYYAGWYSYGNYNDVFTWKPGAIGGHLDSCSACDIRGDKDWSARALRKGITATFGAVNEPYVAGMPEYDQFFLYLTQGGTYGEAAYESTRVGAWMMVWVGDPLYRPYGAR